MSRTKNDETGTEGQPHTNVAAKIEKNSLKRCEIRFRVRTRRAWTKKMIRTRIITIKVGKKM